MVLRQDARLTGEDMAARLGLAQSKVSRLENGKQTTTIDDVAAGARIVGASAEQRDGAPVGRESAVRCQRPVARRG